MFSAFRFSTVVVGERILKIGQHLLLKVYYFLRPTWHVHTVVMYSFLKLNTALYVLPLSVKVSINVIVQFSASHLYKHYHKYH